MKTTLLCKTCYYKANNLLFMLIKDGNKWLLSSDSIFIEVSVLVYFIPECFLDNSLAKSRMPQINFHCEKKH